RPRRADQRADRADTAPGWPGLDHRAARSGDQAARRRRRAVAALAVHACPGSPLHGAAAIGQAVGAVLGRRHMAKHFQISITDDTFSFAQNPLSIAAEAALDGIYVIRTNLPAAQSDAPTGQARGLTAHATVRAYKSLSGVEHAFRSLKTVDLELRPVFHWTAPRVRAHVLLCMLA